MFLTQRFVKRKRVPLEAGNELEGLLGEFFAVIVRGVVARIAIDEPALQFFRAEQAMQSGVAQDVLEDEGVDRLRRADVLFKDLAQEFAGGLQSQFEALDYGVAKDLVIDAPWLGPGERLQRSIQGLAATLQVIEIEFHGEGCAVLFIRLPPEKQR